MGMRKNWLMFVEATKGKSKSHLKAAQYWNSVASFLNLTLIFLGALTTFLAMVKAVPSLAVAGLAAIVTLLSAVSAFLRAGDRRQIQLDASQKFRTLMMEMVRCETEEAYEQLWRDYNKALADEPFLPKKFDVEFDFDWSMTPELEGVVKGKETNEDKDTDEVIDVAFPNDNEKAKLIEPDNRGGYESLT